MIQTVSFDEWEGIHNWQPNNRLILYPKPYPIPPDSSLNGKSCCRVFKIQIILQWCVLIRQMRRSNLYVCHR